MGITGLLRYLRYARRNAHIRTIFRGLTLIVDGYVWLHACVAHHAREVVVHKNYTPVVNMMVWRAKTQLHNGRPILIVLDGKRNASKNPTHLARAARRVRNLASVTFALETDVDGLEIDESTLRVAAAVSEDLVNAVIDAFRQNGIAYLRAAYEADGQLLECSLRYPKSVVLTCDSDLLVLGADFVGMDIRGPEWSSQSCHTFSQSDILNPVIPAHATLDVPIVDGINYALALQIKRLGYCALLAFALLAGNDYCKIPNIGPGIAMKIVCSLELAFSQAPFSIATLLVAARKLKPIDASIDALVHTAYLFLNHQLVYCSETQSMRPLRPLPGTLRRRRTAAARRCSGWDTEGGGYDRSLVLRAREQPREWMQGAEPGERLHSRVRSFAGPPKPSPSSSLRWRSDCP